MEGDETRDKRQEGSGKKEAGKEPERAGCWRTSEFAGSQAAMAAMAEGWLADWRAGTRTAQRSASHTDPSAATPFAVAVAVAGERETWCQRGRDEWEGNE